LRYRDARQKACWAANLLEMTEFRPTVTKLAFMLGVSPGYIAIARKLPVEKRAAIIVGVDKSSFRTLRNPPKTSLALPAPTTNGISDAELMNFARKVGATRMLDAAVAIERAHH
jgi:hypothetical protein